MKLSIVPTALLIALLTFQQAVAARPDPMCPPLRAFLASVGPDETREFTFHTSWGSNFKDDPDLALRAKRCIHNGYGPAMKICDYLMEHGATEFSDNNVKRAITCLSPKTRFAPGMSLNQGTLTFSHGTSNRGSWVEIEFSADKQLGGMAFHLKADGY